MSKETNIHNRSSANDSFTIINRKAIQDKSLSWDARGILAYILSLPSDLVVRQSDLVTRSDKDGRESTASAIKELLDAGYLIKTELPEAGDDIYTLNLVP